MGAPLWRPQCKPEYTEHSYETQLNHKLSQSGAWVLMSCHARYFRDKGLLKALIDLLQDASVVEFAAGCGCYTGALLDSGRISSILALDGVANIGNLTSSLVQTADVTTDVR